MAEYLVAIGIIGVAAALALRVSLPDRPKRTSSAALEATSKAETESVPPSAEAIEPAPLVEPEGPVEPVEPLPPVELVPAIGVVGRAEPVEPLAPVELVPASDAPAETAKVAAEAIEELAPVTPIAPAAASSGALALELEATPAPITLRREILPASAQPSAEPEEERAAAADDFWNEPSEDVRPRRVRSALRLIGLLAVVGVAIGATILVLVRALVLVFTRVAVPPTP